MLKSLTVSNFALIENANIEFAEGLNILTGETGAGKSIVIDALNTILGGRASADYIRDGEDCFRVEAIFDITHYQPIQELMCKSGVETEDDGLLIISRRFNRSGKNTIILNGCHVTLSVLKQFGQKLVDMHGQHENQALLRPESHLAMLDSFDSVILEKVSRYKLSYQKWYRLNKELIEAETRSRERVQRLDMLKWQTDEIAAASLSSDEDTQLEKQIKLLGNLEKVAYSVNRAYTFLNDGNSNNGILTSLTEVKRELENAIRFDTRLEPHLSVITEALYQLKETCMDLSGYCDSIEYNPQQLEQMQERMDIIYKLKRKYGATIDEILDYYRNSLDEITSINNFDEELAKLAKEHRKLESDLIKSADEIDLLRRKASAALAGEVCHHLQMLGIPNAKFIIEVKKIPQINQNGCNDIVLNFSANAGEITKPLQKIASGGELSRIALAIKTVCAHRDKIGVVVFDEIDSGIGGQTAHMVGEKIAMVACSKQVLCITHSPQIACMADRHIYIKKQVIEDRTKTVIKSLNESERQIEISRMIAGNDLTQLAVDNAREMIKTASQKKEKWKKQALA